MTRAAQEASSGSGSWGQPTRPSRYGRRDGMKKALQIGAVFSTSVRRLLLSCLRLVAHSGAAATMPDRFASLTEPPSSSPPHLAPAQSAHGLRHPTPPGQNCRPVTVAAGSSLTSVIGCAGGELLQGHLKRRSIVGVRAALKPPQNMEVENGSDQQEGNHVQPGNIEHR